MNSFACSLITDSDYCGIEKTQSEGHDMFVNSRPGISFLT